MAVGSILRVEHWWWAAARRRGGCYGRGSGEAAANVLRKREEERVSAEAAKNTRKIKNLTQLVKEETILRAAQKKEEARVKAERAAHAAVELAGGAGERDGRELFLLVACGCVQQELIDVSQEQHIGIQIDDATKGQRPDPQLEPRTEKMRLGSVEAAAGRRPGR